MQYTIRSIPAALDQVIRERARRDGKSLNEIAVAALADGLGLGATEVVRRDVSDIAGTWKPDVAVEEALAEEHRVDEDPWR